MRKETWFIMAEIAREHYYYRGDSWGCHHGVVHYRTEAEARQALTNLPAGKVTVFVRNNPLSECAKVETRQEVTHPFVFCYNEQGAVNDALAQGNT